MLKSGKSGRQTIQKEAEEEKEPLQADRWLFLSSSRPLPFFSFWSLGVESRVSYILDKSVDLL